MYERKYKYRKRNSLWYFGSVLFAKTTALRVDDADWFDVGRMHLHLFVHFIVQIEDDRGPSDAVLEALAHRPAYALQINIIEEQLISRLFYKII